jgi:hypothetical protein
VLKPFHCFSNSGQIGSLHVENEEAQVGMRPATLGPHRELGGLRQELFFGAVGPELD